MRLALSLAFTAATLGLAIGSSNASEALGRGLADAALPGPGGAYESAELSPGYEALQKAPLPVARAIHTSAVRHGVPVELVAAVAWQESRFRQNAVSSAGALGVMQLTPDTADTLKVDPHSLEGNVDGGAKYLAKLLKRFGDTRLALAAYNAGPNSVKRFGGVPPYAETQHYVTVIMDRLEAGEPTRSV
ncbi:lytic transglycosylase domain-containing protein [Phenylobacterium sp.]|uniref:lytic transglycosylase domain-containing protein n=1 Tax=Phenylobacterium sp. TaxID=1871053 RepID=UPI002F958CFD